MRQSFAALSAALLSGCSPTLPHRTELSSVPQRCAGAPAQPRTAQQGNTSHEQLRYADLFFVEFDDQGLQYPQGSEFGHASCHIEALMAGLESLATKAGLSIVVYVHGWKHNAAAGDRDVEEFHKLLKDAELVEQAKAERGGTPHRVVGIYVSWRGKSLDLPEPLISLSFWDRKNTAQHVAQGESRALFARLRAFQTAQNSPPPARGPARAAADAEKLSFPEKKVLLILIGHSFGGLIIYNSVAQSLINSLYEAAPNAQGKKVLARFADMIIIANPAIEALRYTPLHRAAACSTFDEYQTPIFVSITSTADWATRLAFPAGRYLSTVLENHASEEEKEANRRTIGHMDGYITHELGVAEAGCEGWKAADKGTLPTLKQASKNLDLEISNASRFFANLPASPNWSRSFCGNTKLTHTGGDRYSPIWNIRTTGEIVPGHNDIIEPIFINFVRQLYHDVILSEIIRPSQE